MMKSIISHSAGSSPSLPKTIPPSTEKLGIELSEGFIGWAALTRQRTYYGIAKHFRLGEAVLENGPVIALPTLKDQQNFVIFGTNMLEQFLATLDYPDKRLILSS